MLIDDTRCSKCKREFDPPRVVKWGTVGVDLRHSLPACVLEDDLVTRFELPVCGQCWELLCGDISGISVHPNDIPRLGARKPLEPLLDPSGDRLASIAGIPVYVDDTLEPSKVELRYGPRILGQVNRVDCEDG